VFDLKKSIFDDLSDDWNKLFSAVGVESLEELEKGGKKDTSKLVPVKKQITRGGRTVETTVYVSPKEAEEMKSKKSPDEEKKPRAKKKTQPKGKMKAKAGTEVIAPHDDEALANLHTKLDGWNDKEVAQALKEASQDHYLIALKSGDGISGVGSFKRKGGKLHMEHFASNKEVRGGGRDVIRHLLDEAAKRNLGVSISPPKGSSKFLKKLGFTDSELDGKLSLSAEEVQKAVGGSADGESGTAADGEKAPKGKTEKPKEKPKQAPKRESADSEKKKLTKQLRTVRKQLGSDHYRDMLAFSGVTWEKASHTGANTMRATMAAAEFIKGGGKLDVDGYKNHLEEQDQKAQEKKKADAQEKRKATLKAKAEEKNRPHDLDKDYFDVGFGKAPSGREVFMISGQPKSITGMSDEDKGFLKELEKVRTRDEFTKLYYRLEDDGKLTDKLSNIFSDINDRYELKDKLFKAEGYRVALGRSDAEKLGAEINSNTEPLTQDEETAVLNYTGSQSTVTNRYFREQSTEPNEAVEDLSSQLDTILNRNKLTEDVMVYRGAGFHAIGGEMAQAILQGDSDKFIGAEITDLGYMSTSLGATSMFQGDVTFQIKAPKGTKGMYLEKHTATRGEHEVLLPRATTLKVQEIKSINGKIQILAEVAKQDD